LLLVHRRNWQRLKYEPSTPDAGRKDLIGVNNYIFSGDDEVNITPIAKARAKAR